MCPEWICVIPGRFFFPMLLALDCCLLMLDRICDFL